MPFDLGTFGSAIAGAVIGGALAGFFSLRSVDKNYRNQQKQRQESEEKLIKGML